jgi:exopolyphosphatase/guanosine-5'-triphosphate,3'-diphosphate pyrophosphatase
VFDIGGGSTECILGRNYEAIALESASIGCVSLSNRHFPDGGIDRESFERARLAARGALAPFSAGLSQPRLEIRGSTSGTAKALWQAAQTLLGVDRLTREALGEMTGMLLKAGHVDRLRIDGLASRPPPGARRRPGRDERGVRRVRPRRDRVLSRRAAPGRSLRPCSGAVMATTSARSPSPGWPATIAAIWIMASGFRRPPSRCFSREPHGRRGPAAPATSAGLGQPGSPEVGMTISHEDFHKHSGYVLTHADMPGFSQARAARAGRIWRWRRAGGLPQAAAALRRAARMADGARVADRR